MEQKLHQKRDKNCLFLGFDLRFPGWEATAIIPILHSDITVFLKFYISIHKVLELPWRYFTPMKLSKCCQFLHPSPKVASTPNRTKTNHPSLNHLETLHIHWVTPLHTQEVPWKLFQTWGYTRNLGLTAHPHSLDYHQKQKI